jgi:hypothetical protein
MTRNIKILWIVFTALVVVVGTGVGIGAYFLVKSGVTRPFDNMFGDQHLKTAVALVELHKVRYGRYPKTLHDLRFLGEWDQIVLDAVEYCTDPDGARYFLEVRTGWIGKPELSPPPEFWQGTGFNKSLGPCRRRNRTPV